MDEDIRAYYESGAELDRVGQGYSRIEFARTKELLERHLPAPPARVLDVGGGPGAYAEWLVSDLAEGQHRAPRDRPALFTTAYFRPEELRAEVEEAGFAVEGVLGVEGPGWLLEEQLDDELVREDVLRVARALEQEPTTIGTSAHLLAIARRP